MFELTPIDSLIQCGLGDWAEGPVLIERLGGRPWLAVEPVHRYCFEAWKNGFVGTIVQMALWNETGAVLDFYDWRTRTSVFNSEDRGLGKIQTYTMTLDDVIQKTRVPCKSNALLWMDTEGCEIEILRGATETIPRVSAIICELKEEPKLPAWPKEYEVKSFISGLGFEFITKDGDDGLFIRKKL